MIGIYRNGLVVALVADKYVAEACAMMFECMKIPGRAEWGAKTIIHEDTGNPAELSGATVASVCESKDMAKLRFEEI